MSDASYTQYSVTTSPYTKQMADDEENGIEYYGRKKAHKEILNGYDSDSEGYGESDSEKEDKEPSEDEKKDEEKEDDDDDDMFASDKEESKPAQSSGFDIDEFEREQGLGQYDKERVLEDEEHVDEGQAGIDVQERQMNYHNNIEALDGVVEKPKDDVQIEAFNLREEADQGILDKDLNYIPKNEDEETEEAWLADIKSSDIENAKKAQLKREAGFKTKTTRPTGVLLSLVINLLEPSETPLEALARLSPKKKKGKRQPALEDEKLRKKKVYDITGACDELMNEKGIAQALEMSREELMRHYKQETGEEFVIDRGIKRKADSLEEEPDDYGPKEWEFRWNGEEQIHGPYSAYEMNYWKESYFNEDVEVRKTGETTFSRMNGDDF